MSRRYRVPVADLPSKNYKLTIKNSEQEIDVESRKLPKDTKHGIPGSILSIVEDIDESLIDHACGGVQACSTCHIYVSQGFDTCNESSEREEDYLDQARGRKLNSRLACCCVPDGTENIVIEIPKWNVNMVKEGH